MRTLINVIVPLGTALAVAAVTTSAWAHVTVTATDTTPGASDVEITFRVPNELPSARITRVAVQFPLATPIADVLVEPVTGWSFTEKTATLAKPIVTDDGDVTQAVSEIDWRAGDSGNAGIGTGQFGAFTVIAGQLPDAKSLTFKAIQTYSNGTQVSWIEVPAPGSSADLQHPAPVLTLSTQAPPVPAATTAKGHWSEGLSIAALVLAALAACFAGMAYERSRTRA